MTKKSRLDFTPKGDGLANPFAGLSAQGLPEAAAAPAKSPASAIPAKPSKLGRVVLRREKAHRGGKTVIVVDDFAPHIGLRFIEDLSSRLKAHCGCGGTVKDRTIEIQGDQPGRIRELLEREGFRVAGVT